MISTRRSLSFLGGLALTACLAPGADDPGELRLDESRIEGDRRWAGAGNLELVYDTAAASRYLNDHTLIKDHEGRWHLFAITGSRQGLGVVPNPDLERSFAHATAPSIEGPWTPQPDVLPHDPGYFGEVHLWAPHVVEDRGTYYMFYAGGSGPNAAMSVATSTDLYTWRRLPSGPVFRDGLEARDPYVARVNGQWVIYYCATARRDGGQHVVAYRTSSDLVHWSDRKIAYTDPANTSNSIASTESPTVVQHDGWWFLFIGPRPGYVGTDVYRSRDPLHFEIADHAGHIASHAAEVVQDGDDWWVTGAGWFQRGLYAAPLRWETAPAPWQNVQNPMLARDENGVLFAYTRSADGTQVQSRKQMDGSWSAEWEPAGSAITPAAAREGRAVIPTPAQNADGAIELFSAETEGRASGSAPVIARAADGRLEAFALGPGSSSIEHRAQLTPGGAWGPWETFGGPAGAPPVVGRNADGRLEVFALGPGGTYVAHRWQTTPNGSWSPWAELGGPAGSPPVVANDADGRLEVFLVTPVGLAVYKRAQVRPSGTWGGWERFAEWTDAAPTVVANADGRLEAFALGMGGEYVMHRWQTRPNGPWSPWANFGGGAMCTPSAALDASGRLNVFVTAPDGSVHLRVQSVPSGGWNAWQPFSGPVHRTVCGSPG